MNDLAPGLEINDRISRHTHSWTANPSSPSAPAGFQISSLSIRFGRRFLLIVEGSRVYRIDADWYDRLRATSGLVHSVEEIFEELRIEKDFPTARNNGAAPWLHALSLVVAQKCNMGCTSLCQGGAFGAPPQNMPLQTALDAVESCLARPALAIS